MIEAINLALKLAILTLFGHTIQIDEHIFWFILEIGSSLFYVVNHL